MMDYAVYVVPAGLLLFGILYLLHGLLDIKVWYDRGYDAGYNKALEDWEPMFTFVGKEESFLFEDEDGNPVYYFNGWQKDDDGKLKL